MFTGQKWVKCSNIKCLILHLLWSLQQSTSLLNLKLLKTYSKTPYTRRLIRLLLRYSRSRKNCIIWCGTTKMIDRVQLTSKLLPLKWLLQLWELCLWPVTVSCSLQSVFCVKMAKKKAKRSQPVISLQQQNGLSRSLTLWWWICKITNLLQICFLFTYAEIHINYLYSESSQSLIEIQKFFHKWWHSCCWIAIELQNDISTLQPCLLYGNITRIQPAGNQLSRDLERDALRLIATCWLVIWIPSVHVGPQISIDRLHLCSHCVIAMKLVIDFIA